MKRSVLSVLFAAGISCVSVCAQSVQPVISEDLISTGRVVGVWPQTGILTLRAEETGAQLVFQGVNQVPISFVNGGPATIADLQPNGHATVYYRPVGKTWVVAKILVPDHQPLQPRPASSLTGADVKALNSQAANDGDITTQPGEKARIDNDITTKPGEKDPSEHDITRKPAR